MEKLITAIKSLYSIEIISTEKVEKGFLSENHILLTKSGKYFLKKYRFNTKERIEEIHTVKKYFADNSIPVILPLQHKDGTFFFEDGWYALFPFVTGEQFEGDELNESAIVSFAEMLAKIHLLGKQSTIKVGDSFSIGEKTSVLEKIDSITLKIKEIVNPTDFDKRAIYSLELKKKLILENTVDFKDLNLNNDHLIHGDYLAHNVFFSDGVVSHVFDFEKTSYAPRMFELFRSAYSSFSSQDKIDSYIQAYSKVYPISTDELERGKKLYYIKLIHGVWVESEHYLKSNTRVDHFLEDGIRRIELLTSKLG